MAGVMSRSLADITTVAKLMDECKSMGIHTLGPDINESYLKFSVTHKGDIRFGMAAVKGVGEGAVQEILREREKNGPYTSVFNVVERVNLTTCNKKSLESLALAGAFDSFGTVSREQFVTPYANSETFLDALIRYGNRYQNDKAENTMSLFGPVETVEITKPNPPKDCPQWSDLERLNRERDLIGIYISGHPLDEYKIIVEKVCTVRMTEVADVDQFANMDITFGGIVTKKTEGHTKNGKPYGRVTMEDYSGAGEFALFGKEWASFKGFFEPGNSLFVSASVKERHWVPGSYDLSIGRVEFLSDVKDQKIKSITINIPLDSLTSGTVAELTGLVNSNPGTTDVFFNITDPSKQMHVMLQSKKSRLSVNRKIIDFLDGQSDMDYIIN